MVEHIFGNRQTPESHQPANLAYLVTSKPARDPVFKKINPQSGQHQSNTTNKTGL